MTVMKRSVVTYSSDETHSAPLREGSASNLPPADELASVRDQIKALEAREAILRTLLLEDPAARTGNHYLAEIKENAQTRTDLKEMRAMYPQIVDEFTFQNTVMRVVLKRITEDGEIVSQKADLKAGVRKGQP